MSRLRRRRTRILFCPAGRSPASAGPTMTITPTTASPSTASASIRFVPSRWTPCSRPFGPSWHADGDGACRLLPVAASPQFRSRRSDLAQSRSLRPLGGACLDAALLDAASDGVKAVNPKYETLGELSVTLDDIKHFRQLDSRCPGHPEYRWTSGVETTTVPLGQGVATSVGMAIASKWMAPRSIDPDTSCSATTFTRSPATAA